MYSSSSAFSVACLVLALGFGCVATVTPDNTCGGANGYTCNPNDPLGGACCSAAGYCGQTDAYCGSGCQSDYGACTTDSETNVPGLGYFTNLVTYSFSDSAIPEGLQLSDYTVDDTQGNANAIYDHSFVPSNVAISDGYLVLTVPGGQTTSPITCAEVTTSASDILYASVRTTGILTGEPGVVNGMFFYKSDCQEIDIEYLPDASSQSNPPGESPPLQYTNQPVDCTPGDDTHDTKAAPSDATSAEHEYRVDWVDGRVDFYTDGVLQDSFTTNVPTEAGSWIWNIWTNGDPGWSVGPPAGDAVFKISQIVMYYNTTSS